MFFVMKKFILSISMFALILGFASRVVADHQDPDTNKWKIASIAWVKANTEVDSRDIDDKWVVLIGKVTERVDEDTYRLDDGTGSILLDVKDGIELPVGKRVVVRGNVDEAYWDAGELEINIQSWRLESKQD